MRLRNDIFHWSRLCRAPNSEKVIMALFLELSGILWWNFAYTLILTRYIPWDCQMTFEMVEFSPRFKFWKKWDYCKMTFIIGRGFAERQILKKWKWPYLLNWVEYFDRLLPKHWYYQDLAQEIVNCHFSSVEVLPSPKFWKSENGPTSWTEWNIVMKLCIHIGILTRCSHEIVKWHLGLVEVLPRFKFWKESEN